VIYVCTDRHPILRSRSCQYMYVPTLACQVMVILDSWFTLTCHYCGKLCTLITLQAYLPIFNVPQKHTSTSQFTCRHGMIYIIMIIPWLCMNLCRLWTAAAFILWSPVILICPSYYDLSRSSQSRDKIIWVRPGGTMLGKV
jgi:hypothetical protein